MALKPINAAGMLKDINDVIDELEPLLNTGSEEGLGALRVARCIFDAASTDSAGVANTTVAAHPRSVTIPIHAAIVGGYYDVNTAFTSAGSTATIAISVQAANDIVTATAVSNAIYGTIGRKAIVPKANTPESTSVKTTAARAVTFTVAVEALTAGKLTLYLYYVEGVASA